MKKLRQWLSSCFKKKYVAIQFPDVFVTVVLSRVLVLLLPFAKLAQKLLYLFPPSKLALYPGLENSGFIFKGKAFVRHIELQRS